MSTTNESLELYMELMNTAHPDRQQTEQHLPEGKHFFLSHRLGSTCGVGSVWGVFALSGPQGCLHGIEVGLLLEFANVFLVADSLVAKPVGDLIAMDENRQTLSICT